MSWLSSFFKSKKPNLTPDISFQTPSQISPGLYNPMSELAKRRIQAGLTGEETPGVGFGKDFLNAGNLEYAGKMHTDLIDGVNWAIKNNIAHSDKVCIMGAG